MLLAGRVPENNVFFARGVPTTKMLLAGRLPENDVFFARGVPLSKMLKI